MIVGLSGSVIEKARAVLQLFAACVVVWIARNRTALPATQRQVALAARQR